MRFLRRLLLFVSVASLLASPFEAVAAKKKQGKAMPVKIIKASETPFRNARIIEKKKVKKKRFLWFKKKEAKVEQPKMAPIVTVPLSAELRQPQVEETKLIPIPDSPVELDSKKGAKPLSLPEKVTPQVETPADSKSD